MQQTYSLLSLGDSYTIGESLALSDSFPYQAVRMLRQKDLAFSAPEIIARTGWTTDELGDAIRKHRFLPRYDFVTLLAGVNNQYRGRDIIEYKTQFEELLTQAIKFVHGKKDRVIILSIPDYSVTPFASNMDTAKIARDIEVFNSVNLALSVQYKVHYIDITPGTKEAAADDTLLAGDHLHPSAKEYARWAERVAQVIADALKK
ncbi:MAG TPA: SGNH/GDSL hydrolase family protein [Flavisolibacter sp.]